MREKKKSEYLFSLNRAALKMIVEINHKLLHPKSKEIASLKPSNTFNWGEVEVKPQRTSDRIKSALSGKSTEN